MEYLDPLKPPKVSYYMKPQNIGITIRFVIELVDIKFTTNYTKYVTKLAFTIKNSSNGYHQGITKVLDESNMSKPGAFDVLLRSPYYGQYKLDIWALIQYEMGFPLKKYTKKSPVTQLFMDLESYIHIVYLFIYSFIE